MTHRVLRTTPALRHDLPGRAATMAAALVVSASFLSASFLSASLLSGCADPGANQSASAEHARAPLTPEELDAKVLEFLNHESTDLKVLDIDVGLTSTAAKKLIAHRNGPDGTFGTDDDDLFDAIVEVDDVYGVGPSALASLRAFAETWSPPDPNAEPVVDDLDALVLAMLNHPTTTLTILDIDVGLTSTAAKSLIEHRNGPDGALGTSDDDLFDSLQEVDDVKYVGESALAAIQAYAATWDPETNSTSGPNDVPKVLQFLNDVATTRKLLEEEVGLNSTQSANLLAHRDGPDGTSGTEDDDLFDTIDEVDSVKYIGPATMEKIATYAESWEPIDPEAVLAQQVLDFLNHPSTSLEVLDIDVGLNANAAKEIIAARAGQDALLGTEDDVLFETIQQVDDVKYVGASALDQIKAYAATWDPNAEPEPEPEPEVVPLSCPWCGEFAGEPTDYDAGPPAGSGWAELFASVPNYRQVARELGQAWLEVDPTTGKSKWETVNEARALEGLDPIPYYTLTKDKFRYHMGPLFYRGRLDGTARVLVVGQEGATDEALVHRAFVGGTGQKVQNFLNSIGITRSYICVNTFVYSIYEQYDEFTDELAQQTEIRTHRDQILAKIFEENDIELVLTFGGAAHASVKNFRETVFGGDWPDGVRWSHMVHPGAAALAYAPDSSGTVVDAEGLSSVVNSFATSWKRIWYWRYIDPGWLESDPDGWTFQSSSFYFGDRDIPYRDLPYGASPQSGRGGTKSERAKSGLQVQLRSQYGVRYEAPNADFPATASKADSGLVTDLPEEVSWEPHKLNPDTRHDPGPGAEWAAFFANTPAQATIEAEAGVDANNDFSDVPLWYRGRLSGTPWLLVIAQDYGSDQIIAGRALIGDDGQKINHLLENLGAGTDYLMLNPYPYPLNDSVSDFDALNLSQSLSLSAWRQALLEKLLAENPFTMVITFGELAEAAFQPVAPEFSGQWVHLSHPREADAVVSWNAALQTVGIDEGLDGPRIPYTLAGFADTRAMIPRQDLPWGKPMWFGTSGDLSQQPDRSWIFWNAPKWVKYEPPVEATE